MKLGHLATTAETHLNDLQAEIEAGARQLDRIHQTGSRLQDSLLARQFEQVTLMQSLLKRVLELKASIAQQQQTMRELREDIRTLNGQLR